MKRESKTGIQLTEALAWLPSLKGTGLRWNLGLVPGMRDGQLWASVELQLEVKPSTYVCFKRWGEEVSRASQTAYLGAWYRAAVAAHSWVEGKSPADIRKLARWELDIL